MPQLSAHLSRFSRSFCSLLWSFWLLISRYNKQSSAKSLTDDLTASGRSLLWQRNSMGPSTVPCGTPETTVTCWDDSPSNIDRDSSAVRRLFVRLAGAVGRQSALHKENSGFAAATLRRHISTFRGYQILFSIQNPYINCFTNHFSIHS